MGIRSFYQPSDFDGETHEPTKCLLAYIWSAHSNRMYYVDQLDWARFLVFPKCSAGFKLNASSPCQPIEFIDPNSIAVHLSIAHQEVIKGLLWDIRQSIRPDKSIRPVSKNQLLSPLNLTAQNTNLPVDPTKEINLPHRSKSHHELARSFPSLIRRLQFARNTLDCADLDAKISESDTAVLIYVGSVLVASIHVSNLQLVRWDAKACAKALRVQAALSHVQQGKRFSLYSLYDAFVAAIKHDRIRWKAATTHEEKKPKGSYDPEMAAWCRKVGGVPGYSRLGRAGYGVLGLEDSGAVGRKAKKMKVIEPTAEDLQRQAEEAAAAEKQRVIALQNRIHELRLRADKFRQECAKMRTLAQGKCHTAAQRDLNRFRLEKAMQCEAEAIKLETLADSLTLPGVS